MRTIDADALKEQFREGAYTVKGIREEIDNTPTVDIKAFANITFDKDELEQIVRDKVIEPIKNGELVVEVEDRPQGSWNYIQTGMCICPFCGAMPHKLYKNYCAKCGADMRGGRE